MNNYFKWAIVQLFVMVVCATVFWLTDCSWYWYLILLVNVVMAAWDVHLGLKEHRESEVL